MQDQETLTTGTRINVGTGEPAVQSCTHCAPTIDASTKLVVKYKRPSKRPRILRRALGQSIEPLVNSRPLVRRNAFVETADGRRVKFKTLLVESRPRLEPHAARDR